VIKFRDATRRLGHPVVIEQKFLPGDTDFRRQLRVIQESRVDGIVLWTDIGPTAMILQQMRELGMQQRVFGSHRTIGDELVKLAGQAAEGFEAVYPYDPTRREQKWTTFNQQYETRFNEKPDHFGALAYDAMQVLLGSICRAGLNRGRIRDALTGVTSYKGVTGDMNFDPNCKNISPMFLASVHNGTIEYRRITMEKPYARVGEDGVRYAGPALHDEQTTDVRIAVFGNHADQIVKSEEIARLLDSLNTPGRHVSLVSVSSDGPWGQASTELVRAVYEKQILGIIAIDRNASHLAEQIGTKAFVPVIAISSDRMLTSTNIPWIFRLPQDTPLDQALRCFSEAAFRTGPNRGKIRDLLASGTAVAGVSFQSTGELTTAKSGQVLQKLETQEAPPESTTLRRR
jgi:phosphoribosylcarboxyaminoimidazole (NCAIR) mutase